MGLIWRMITELIKLYKGIFLLALQVIFNLSIFYSRIWKGNKETNIDMKRKMISYDEALAITLNNISNIESEMVSIINCSDCILAEELRALVDSPSVDASLKEGYAIRSEEIEQASPETPVKLKLIGQAPAGGVCNSVVTKGTAVQVFTGAKVPEGATAVVAEEFTHRKGDHISVFADAGIGRNILAKGSDVALDDVICAKGDRLAPGMIGILAAAGHHQISVYRKIKVAIIATGDEVVIPGRPLPEGKLYASNMATLNAWCRRYGMETSLDIVKDDPENILATLQKAVDSHDAVLTSGGAWMSDRDYVVNMLNKLGWKQHFHGIRIGPGKAVGFGSFDSMPVFMLPGGPPSNLIGFLEIALPGLLKLNGFNAPRLPEMKIELDDDVEARKGDWTQFVFGIFEEGKNHSKFKPLKQKSRLQSMAMAQGIISIPEGVHLIRKGTVMSAQMLM